MSWGVSAQGKAGDVRGNNDQEVTVAASGSQTITAAGRHQWLNVQVVPVTP